jgi:hypothetical protein
MVLVYVPIVLDLFVFFWHVENRNNPLINVWLEDLSGIVIRTIVNQEEMVHAHPDVVFHPHTDIHGFVLKGTQN